MSGAELYDCSDLFGAAGKDNSIWSVRLMIRLVPAMLGADRLRGGETVAQQLPQLGEKEVV